MRQIEEIAGETPGVKHTVAIAGQSLLLNANAPNFGSMYVMLDDFHDRPRPEPVRPTPSPRSCRRGLQDEIRDGAGQRLRRPAGRRPGHGRRLQDHDRGPRRPRAWPRCRTSPTRSSPRATSTPGLQGLFTSFRANTPWLYLDIDRDAGQVAWACRSSDVFNTLQVYLGSLYVNDFNRFGRTWQVNVQADADFRKQIDDLKQLKVRNDQGEMVPLGTLATVRDVERPGDDHALQHVSRRPPINGNAGAGRQLRPGHRRCMEQVAEQSCRRSMRSEWTELALLQLQTGNTAMLRLRCWPWCSCSWCWPPSTKAGRCRWPSSWSCRCACSARSPACCMAQHGHQHLHADRLRGAGRPGVQERDPDRRVRQGAARGGRCRGARRRWRPASCGCGRSS